MDPISILLIAGVALLFAAGKKPAPAAAPPAASTPGSLQTMRESAFSVSVIRDNAPPRGQTFVANDHAPLSSPPPPWVPDQFDTRQRTYESPPPASPMAARVVTLAALYPPLRTVGPGAAPLQVADVPAVQPIVAQSSSRVRVSPPRPRSLEEN